MTKPNLPSISLPDFSGFLMTRTNFDLMGASVSVVEFIGNETIKSLNPHIADFDVFTFAFFGASITKIDLKVEPEGGSLLRTFSIENSAGRKKFDVKILLERGEIQFDCHDYHCFQHVAIGTELEK